MNIDGVTQRTIRLASDGWSIEALDQTKLPHAVVWVRWTTLPDAIHAIRTMQVRGAPLIGAAAAYGLCLALRADPSAAGLDQACADLGRARPTAVNLQWAIAAVRDEVVRLPAVERTARAYELAGGLCEQDVATNRAIGVHGADLIRATWERHEHEAPVQVLTHCNAGWLATVDWGTALAPVYLAHGQGIPVHVWVDETRPRNQGANLTAWELGQHGVPHTLVVDNAGGHLMQRGLVDLCLVGTDRTTATGDVCNKIGTYLKALAARDNHVPFYVCAPSTSIDWHMTDGIREIPIEERDADEVLWVNGMSRDGVLTEVRIGPRDTSVRNDAFDVTPARLVTGLITERGICSASREGLASLFAVL